MARPRDPFAPHSRYNGRRGASSSANVVHLPADGCDLPVPKMPPGRDWTAAQRARWRELWRSPQATQWDESVKGTVALLVAYESLILEGEAAAWVAQEARHAAESLGLTPKAMHALGWVIA